MRITSSAVEAVRKTFSLVYQQGYDAVQPWAPRIATSAPSNNRENVYGFLAKLPTMREWVGDRVLNNIAEHDFTVTNRDYELSIEVDRNDIEDDNFGVHTPKLEMMGMAARKQFDYLLVSLLQGGQSALCYDGQNFFDTDHPNSKFDAATGSQRNYYSTGRALTLDNYVAMRAEMMGYLGEDGKPLAVTPSLLIVPPQLEHVAKQITMADLVINTTGATPAAGAAAMTNVMRGTAEVLMVPELASQATTWYLVDASKPMKPFVTQTRKAPQFVNLGEGSEHAARTKKFMYGVDMRGAAGYGLWFLASKCVA